MKVTGMDGISKGHQRMGKWSGQYPHKYRLKEIKQGRWMNQSLRLWIEVQNRAWEWGLVGERDNSFFEIERAMKRMFG